MNDCPHCRGPNPDSARRCVHCSAVLTPATAAETAAITAAAAAATGGPTEFMPPPPPALTQGAYIAGRYEIRRKLGHGGMGAVYEVMDHEFERVAALKIIRPEWAGDPAIVKRFKQELILARQISHPSVIQIYDIGNEGGMWYISMAFVQGKDLAHLVEEQGKLPLAQAVSIVRKIAGGLQAAHTEGVVHRDLKPQNIMVQPDGNVTVMDFGIARSTDGSSMTRSGALIGTPAYMSPEQAKGEPIDTRTDIFSLGIIFYELLTGQLPFRADSTMATLLKRCQESPKPPNEVDPTIPRALSDIVMKALARERKDRYQSVQDLIEELERWTNPRLAPLRRISFFNALLALTALIGIANLAVWYRSRSVAPPTSPPRRVSLLVADFANSTNEPVFDGTLEPIFVVGLEGASFIACYDRGAAHRLGGQLSPGEARLDLNLARLVAAREGINAIVTGTVSREGDGYSLSVTATDAPTGREILSRRSGSIPKDRVLTEVTNLVTPVRAALGDKFSGPNQVYEGETFTSRSLESMHSYAQAQQLLWNGKYDDAARNYQEAIRLDPDFGRAYAGLAVLSANTGKLAEAGKYFDQAMARMSQMTDREKYRTRGTYYTYIRDDTKAVEELSNLVRLFPADTSGPANLALAYLYRRDMANMLKEGRRAVELYPTNVIRRNNLALYYMYSGDFEAARREAEGVLKLNDSFEKAYLAIGLSEMAAGHPDKAAEAWSRLATLGKRGASWSYGGAADMALYQGLTTPAIESLEKGIFADEANKSLDEADTKRLMLAQVHLERGRIAEAIALAARVVARKPSDSQIYSAARMYIGSRRMDQARKLAAQLAERIGPEARSNALLLEAEIALLEGKGAAAIAAATAARKLCDSWLAHYFLARASLEAKNYQPALREIEICLKRKGEVTAVFLDDSPTLRYLPPVYYYQAKLEEALNAPAAAQTFAEYAAIRARAEQDPWLAEAQSKAKK